MKTRLLFSGNKTTFFGLTSRHNLGGIFCLTMVNYKKNKKKTKKKQILKIMNNKHHAHFFLIISMFKLFFTVLKNFHDKQQSKINNNLLQRH